MAREIGRSDPTTLVKFSIIFLVDTSVIVTNLIALFVLLMDRRLRNHRSSHFVISLCAADLCVGVFLFPIAMVMSVINTSYRHREISAMFVFAGMTALNASFYTLLAIFVDKYVGILRPLQYGRLVTTRRCRVITAIIWLLSAVLMIPVLTGWSSITTYRDSFLINIQLGLRNPHSIILAVFVYVPVPLIIVVLALHIFVISQRHVRKIKGEQRRFNSQTSLNTKGAYKESELSRTLFIITVTLFLCWGPCSIYGAYLAFSQKGAVVPWIEFISTWAAFSHCFINCIIHCVLNPHFRKSAANQLSCCICCWRKEQERHVIWMTSSRSSRTNGSRSSNAKQEGQEDRSMRQYQTSTM